ncbi:hypothetical protein [Nocardioides sp.]|uniref:DUF7065 domain-containing protein n=1 Tax=Nocardioides sp. TaxID=35761 RepID=UPI002601DB67|nr:hypothetical protein [Nocardioides sp.]MCW2737950.1 hypothetical protein [Nocardioides sp.]
MIIPEDSDFHERDTTDRTWAETTVLLFSVPEAGIIGNAYVLARPNLGVATSAVIIAQGFCRQPFEVDFTDPQVHQPCPDNFSNYTLPSGLSVEVTKPPVDYHFTYEHALGAASFDLTFTGLSQPFDIHDKNQNPLLADQMFDSLGDQWKNGHFELLGHVQGELQLRGKTYKIDSFEGMDHSWGPRLEEGRRALSWMPIAFGEDLGMHIVTALDIVDGRVVYGDLRFGHVVDHGEVYGLVEARIEADHVDLIGVRNHVYARDVRGKEYDFYGTSLGGHPYHQFNPCSVAYQSLFRYDLNGRIGHGVGTDVYGLDFLADRMSRHGRQRGGTR